jgi:hypothetical protein
MVVSRSHDGQDKMEVDKIAMTQWRRAAFVDIRERALPSHDVKMRSMLGWSKAATLPTVTNIAIRLDDPVPHNSNIADFQVSTARRSFTALRPI